MTDLPLCDRCGDPIPDGKKATVQTREAGELVVHGVCFMRSVPGRLMHSADPAWEFAEPEGE